MIQENGITDETLENKYINNDIKQEEDNFEKVILAKKKYNRHKELFRPKSIAITIYTLFIITIITMGKQSEFKNKKNLEGEILNKHRNETNKEQKTF